MELLQNALNTFLFGPSDLSDFHFWWYPLMTQAILAAGGCGGLAAAGCRAGSAGLYVHGAIFQQLPHAPLSSAGCPCGKKIEKKRERWDQFRNFMV